MKIYDLKVALKSGSEKTHWKTVGKIFTNDSCKIAGNENKPAGFVIDWPPAQGIVVIYEPPKKEGSQAEGSGSGREPGSDDEQPPI